MHRYYVDSDECKIKLGTCLNELKNSKTKESDTLVKLTKCHTESEAVQERLDSKRYEILLNLEKDNATCHREMKIMKEQSARCENDRVSCQHNRDRLRDEHMFELDKCQNDKSDKLVKLTECQTERKAMKTTYDSNEIIKLEKDNVTCQNEKRNLKEKYAKYEMDRVSCEHDRDTLKDEYATLNKEYVKCDRGFTRYRTQIENEKNGNENGNENNEDENNGNENNGDENNGDENNGDENNGNENNGNENNGNENNGNENNGNENNGNENNGDENHGDENNGNENNGNQLKESMLPNEEYAKKEDKKMCEENRKKYEEKVKKGWF